MRTILSILFLGMAGIFSATSCSSPGSEDVRLNQTDSSEVIQLSLQQLFDVGKGQLNPIYYQDTVMLVTSRISDRKYQVTINGRPTLFLPKSPERSEINWKEPQPIVEVFSFQIPTKDSCNLEIRLPTTGLFYNASAKKGSNHRWNVTVGDPGHYK